MIQCDPALSASRSLYRSTCPTSLSLVLSRSIPNKVQPPSVVDLPVPTSGYQPKYHKVWYTPSVVDHNLCLRTLCQSCYGHIYVYVGGWSGETCSCIFQSSRSSPFPCCLLLKLTALQNVHVERILRPSLNRQLFQLRSTASSAQL